ncbi:MAG: hypothetical protein FWH27_03555 [Planctomycetaceae bacterium]|nr:hypothetical protein [Planctomycetaceae bacterium]
MGEQLEQFEEILLNEVRSQEELPLEDAKVFAVSLDGANVRLNTPGKKKGRPTERPKDDDSMSRQTPSCFTNAMVGVCSLYGEVPEITGENSSFYSAFCTHIASDVFAQQRLLDGVQAIPRERLADWQRPGLCATSATKSGVQKHRETANVL